MTVLLTPAVTSRDHSTSAIHTESLRPPQTHSSYKVKYYSISYLNTLNTLPDLSINIMLWCYTLFKVPYFPQDR